MFAVWAKLMKGEKITVNALYEFDGQYIKDEFFDYMSHICGEMDIPVPVILDKHTKHFTDYNNTAFAKGDFVETVKFDKLVIEFVKDESGKRAKAPNPLND